MRVVIQRVLQASVNIEGVEVSKIAGGLLVFVGIEDNDTFADVQWLSSKIINLRIFDDEQRVPNISLIDNGGDLLLVSQFTLHASTKKGNRPSYIKASKPAVAVPLYENLVERLAVDLGKKIFTGKFGADMQVTLINDGPVTIWIDSKNRD